MRTFGHVRSGPIDGNLIGPGARLEKTDKWEAYYGWECCPRGLVGTRLDTTYKFARWVRPRPLPDEATSLLRHLVDNRLYLYRRPDGRWFELPSLDFSLAEHSDWEVPATLRPDAIADFGFFYPVTLGNPVYEVTAAGRQYLR